MTISPHTPSDARHSVRRLVALDILRGLAALSVFLTHLKLVGFDNDTIGAWFLAAHASLLDFLFRGGADGGGNHPAVVLFIVVSGFCIHLPLALNPGLLRSHNFWKRYFVRRIVRLFPLYALGCGAGYLVAAMVVNGNVFAPRFFDPSLHLGNYLLKLFFLGPLLPNVDTKLGNPPLETVAAEIWLYALYPFALFVHQRAGIFGVIALAAISHAFSILLVPLGIDPLAMASGPARFLLYWLMGAAACECLVRTSSNHPRAFGRAIVLCAGFLLALAACGTLSFRGAYLFRVFLLAGAAACLLYALALREWSRRTHEGFIVRTLGALGERSYSLYVVHWPALAVAAAASVHLGLTSYPRLALCVIVTAIATLLAYSFIEKPSHRLARRLSAVQREWNGSV